MDSLTWVGRYKNTFARRAAITPIVAALYDTLLKMFIEGIIDCVQIK